MNKTDKLVPDEAIHAYASGGYGIAAIIPDDLKRAVQNSFGDDQSHDYYEGMLAGMDFFVAMDSHPQLSPFKELLLGIAAIHVGGLVERNRKEAQVAE